MFLCFFSIKLFPVINGSAENETFFKYTPGGELNLAVVNIEAAKQFEVGKEYYIDISEKVEKLAAGMTYDSIRVNTHMTFGNALEAVKQGKGMRLPTWKPDVIIRAQYPDEHSKMTAPYLYVESRFGKVPWKETMIEMFSEEWEIVE
jgi:tRNA U54 and U55 pseudouridine synthase Pus10